ncbi:sensor histidine kinase [Gayadomonas joobiniege]|uniref:sensor histidine kinase n=1 Tax=Gayadomonas joobiniege TaxID=1234606 RepID=UPI000381CB5D|nr:PAS domain-containing sensor histidine kinase [Gayadomonas joobiniege]
MPEQLTQDARLEKLEHLLQVLPNGVVVLNQQGIVEQANPIACELLGEPLVGQKWRALIEKCFSPKDDDGHEISLANGKRIKLQTTALTPYSGQVIVLDDMTHTRALQARIGQMQKLSALGRMMASLAHQIRTPLSAALLYAGNLAQVRKDVSESSFSQKLISRLEDIEQQISDMLLYVRCGQTSQAEAFSLDTLFEQLAIAAEASINQQNAQVNFIPTAQTIQLYGQANTLVSALNNLIQNSLQTRRSGLKIDIQAQLLADKKTVQITVNDNGPGIQASHAAKIFEPFYSAQQSSGLGLTVVKAVVEQHQGKIKLREQSKGCCFVIELPCHLMQERVNAA